MTLLKTYPVLPFEIDRAKDVYLYDTTGKRYLDFYAGHAVASTGHCHPEVVRAIQEQASRLIFYSNAIGLPIREEAAAKLLLQAPDGFTHVFFANSGAEANENALKLARQHTGRTKILAFKGGFHGRTAGVEALDYTTPFGELPELSAAVAAVILEPIQSMAGVKTAPPEYFQELRALCSKHGVLMIFDEVQTGIGRTGNMYFGEEPDLITLAKGIASGVPCSAVLVRDEIAQKVEYGQYGATFGAGPLAMAAVKATLEVVEPLLPNVRETGKVLWEKLENLSGVEEVRGKGFLLGIQTARDAKKLQAALLKQGVIVGIAKEPGVLRLLPPLTLKPEHVESFTEAWNATLH